MPVRCNILVHSLRGLKETQGQLAVDAAVHSLDYWLAQARSCGSLQPVEQSTTFVCSDATHLGVVAWARLRGVSEAMVTTAASLASPGPGDAVAVVDASFVYGPHFSLPRLLQLASVRAKDILAFTPATATTLASPECCPVIASDPGPCPKLRPISDPGATGSQNQWHSALPLVVLTSTSAAKFARAGDGRQLNCAALLATNDTYGSGIAQVWRAEEWVEEQAAMRAELLRQSPALEDLPERFRRADWDYSMVRKQHPVYVTSNNCFGAKKPSHHELHESWSGIRGGLAAFGAARGKHSGLSTGIRMSKVHHSLDGWC